MSGAGHVRALGTANCELCSLPYSNAWFHLIACIYLSAQPILNFLINGHFNWDPTWGFRSVKYTNPGGGQPPFDYIGLNYYSR